MNVRLYGIPLSHPVATARLMLQHKGIPFRETTIVSGFHPPVLRVLGFRGGTVPVLRIDDRRVEGSRPISRALDDLRPEPRLFPDDPRERERVEEIERWAEDELQDPARRLVRWAVVRHREVRESLVRVNGLPLVGVLSILIRPLAAHFARVSRADDATVREDLRLLPGRLDRIEAWIAEGRIGGARPNAADFQIAPSLRLLLAFEDLVAVTAERPAADLALRFVPDHPVTFPSVFPREWLPSRHDSGA